MAPMMKVTTAMTTALAASTDPRWGMAVKVVRIRPRRYSTVMNSVATTISTIRATMIPNSIECDAVLPPSAVKLTAGAMSPEPVSATASCERWELPDPSVG